ncbi:50S ribosomal protein L7/L12 [Candidatus Tremblaya princeps]|uniref:Large ribosomal subunit protein bL12 n=1 Tax=Tremblaya princeps TaxID=189385 RepID=A0A143WR35_TREPR|nr:50S ribosomal protein L7/L12 [Candidatus Tremblaya princeps]
MISKDDIAARIESMTALELSDLVGLLERRFNIARQSNPTCTPGAPQSSTEPERSDLKVFLTHAGPNKIALIRAIRDVTKLGLKESKGLADSAPSILAEGLTRDAAEDVRCKIEAAGARAEVR